MRSPRIRRLAALAIIALAAGLSSCGGESLRPGQGAGQGLELRRVGVNDPQINGIEAYRVLVPGDWRFTGVVEWRHDLATLASAVMVVEDPTTGVALESYFLVPHAFSETSLIPLGGNWAGSIVARPVAAADYITQFVVPGFRPGATLLSSEPMPAVAAATAASIEPVAGMTSEVDSARVRIAYDRAGTAFEEDFFVTLTYRSGLGLVSWVPSHLHSMRAPSGTLERQEALLQTVLSSVEVTPLWAANYQAVFDLFLQGQYAAIRSAGELSQYIARSSEEIAEIYRTAYEEREAAYDRVLEGFSEYVRGVEPYDVPDVGRVLIENDRLVCHYPTEPKVLLNPLGTVCPGGTVLLQPVR